MNERPVATPYLLEIPHAGGSFRLSAPADVVIDPWTQGRLCALATTAAATFAVFRAMRLATEEAFATQNADGHTAALAGFGELVPLLELVMNRLQGLAQFAGADLEVLGENIPNIL